MRCDILAKNSKLCHRRHTFRNTRQGIISIEMEAYQNAGYGEARSFHSRGCAITAQVLRRIYLWYEVVPFLRSRLSRAQRKFR